MLRECVVLVLVCVFGAGGLSGRGFFCRDPDTGKLHPANSTWTATTFCGKYHCKLKRKNITGSHYAPQRQINITNIQPLGENLTTVDVQNKEVVFKTEEPVNDTIRTEPDIIQSNNTLKESQVITLDDIIEGKNVSDKERFLSEQEIKSLIKFLHTLKKGDLDTIVEIYNLAQDIYKELDKTSTDHVLQEVMTTAETLSKQISNLETYNRITKHNQASYWYEPLSSGKTRLTDILKLDVIGTDTNPEVPGLTIALEPPAPKNMISVTKPTPLNVIPVTKPTSIAQMNIMPPIPGFQARKISDSFFTGPFTYTDFGKLPYYYPMSMFQRMASYKHEQNKKLIAYAGAFSPALVNPLPTLALPPVPNIVQKALTNKSKHIGEQYQKEPGPSIFLPYPFTSKQYRNWSLPENMYHRNKLETRRKEESPVDKLELLRREENLYKGDRKGYTFVNTFGKRRKQESVVDKIELLIKEDKLLNPLESNRNGDTFLNPLEKRRKQEIALDKIELLIKREDLFNQLGMLRNEKKIVDKLEARRKDKNIANQLGASRSQENYANQIGPIRKEENFVDKLGARRIDGNIANQLGARGSQENYDDQIGTRRTVKNFVDKLGARRTDGNIATQLGPRRKQETILDKVELLDTDKNLFKNLETHKKEEKVFEKIAIRRNKDINNKNKITIRERSKKKSNVILINPDSENFQDIQISSSIKEENIVNTNEKRDETEKDRKPIERRRPEWQTDSLSQQLLDEVRAHIQEKQRVFIRPIPLRKKVKLERVAKVFNIDNLKRKRSAEEQSSIDESLEPELYEVYIESTTCNSDYSIPGYFRYGNLSQPFPECCPQRIPSR